MSRKASPQATDVASAIGVIKLHCHQAKISVNALSAEASVCQAALWRFINGDRKTITDTARKTLKYIDYCHNCHRNDKGTNIAHTGKNGYQLIESAARSIWDGEPKTAELIASLIKALKPALDVAGGVTNGRSRK